MDASRLLARLFDAGFRLLSGRGRIRFSRNLCRSLGKSYGLFLSFREPSFGSFSVGTFLFFVDLLRDMDAIHVLFH